MVVTVSASDFVRHFGKWQERAGHEAVYIHHHGRARYVLTSVDLLQSMIDAKPQSADFEFARDALLDILDDVIVLTDGQLVVSGMSKAARGWFGRADWRGAGFAKLLPEAVRSIIVNAAIRVRDRGIAERVELGVGPRGPGRIELDIVPFALGVAIVAHDRTGSDRQGAVTALAEATNEAVALIGRSTVLHLNLRGHVLDPPPTLAALTGLTPATLASVRLTSLFDIGSRASVGDAIEATIGDRVARLVVARLMVNRGDAIDVRVAISGIALAASVDRLAVVIDAFRGA